MATMSGVMLLVAAVLLPMEACGRTIDLHRHVPAAPKTLQRRRRLTAAEVDGTSVFGDVDSLGYYYSYLHIGQPPQKQTVIVDTGSSLVAVPCADCADCGHHMDPPYDLKKSTTGRRLMCDSPTDDDECAKTTRIHSDDWGCNPDGRCEFALSYTEGSHLIGHFVEDVVCIADQPCHHRAAEEMPKIRFGCADDMGGLFKSQKADGIMGLGWGAEMALEPLRAENSPAHGTLQLCLTHNGGFLTVGDGDQHVQAIRREGATTWTPMLAKGSHPFFTVKTQMAKVAGASISMQGSGVPTILDSGSTYTYLPRHVWSGIKQQFMQFCDQPGKCTAPASNIDPTALHCIRGAEHLSTFPSLSFYFDPTGKRRLSDGKDNPQLVLEPHEYFFPYLGSHCVGLIVDDAISRMEIGANFLQDHLVTFEPERNEVGFTRADCKAKTAKKRRASEVPAMPLAPTKVDTAVSMQQIFGTGGHAGNDVAALYLVVGAVLAAVGVVAWRFGAKPNRQPRFLLQHEAQQSIYFTAE